MHFVTLAHETDFDGWRRLSRADAERRPASEGDMAGA